MGVSLDANGWSVFTVSSNGFGEGTSYNGTGTRIIYVSTTGSDSNDGSFASPCSTPHHAVSLVRAGAPDWVLLKKGDTFINSHSVMGTTYGQDPQNPLLFSSYDPNASHNPPVPNPYTGGNRPIVQIPVAYAAAIELNAGPLNSVAFAGLDFYAITRDPNGGSFSTTDSQSFITGITSAATMSGTSTFLVEDCAVRSCVEGIDLSSASPYQPISSFTVRRCQIVDNYPPGAINASGIILSAVTGGPATYVLQENVIDHNGWNTAGGITWAPSVGFCHNLYLTGTQTNGDAAQTSSPPTVTGNIISNDGQTSAFRNAGSITNNLFLQNPSSVVMQQATPGFVSQISDNCILNGRPQSSTPAILGIEPVHRYINENIVQGTAYITNNIIAHGVEDTSVSAQGIAIDSGVTATVTNNIVYNWCVGATSSTLINSTGSITALSLTNGGTGYTDNTVTVLSATSSNTAFTSGTFTWSGDGQNYIVCKVSDASNMALYGSIYISTGGLSGVYQATVLDAYQTTPSRYVIIYGSSFSTSFSGTFTYPGYQTNLTTLSGAGSGAQCDLISSGGTIKGIYIYGSDGQTPAIEKQNSPGQGYAVGDTLSDGAGKGLVLTVTATAQNVITSNTLDPTGTNGVVVYPDPNRSVGSYYASIGGTSSATFTGVLSGGVLTISSISGTVGLGDAIIWQGQNKNDYIKKFGSGTGGNGTYTLAGTQTLATSSMSSYSTQKFIDAAKLNNKVNWNTALMADSVNDYIQQGFGILEGGVTRSWIGRF